jgi:hypothetical protein
MEVLLLQAVPRGLKPLRTYETKIISIGFSRYDVEKKILSTLEVKNKKIMYFERPFSGHIFSRAYNTELVRVIVYSDSPKMWSEELSPHEVHFFQQIEQQA